MVVLAMLVVYAVVKLRLLVANAIHVQLDISSFLHAKVNITYLPHHICNIQKWFPSFLISACNCNTQGSNSNNCDANGVCSCKTNIINAKCDTCQSGFFNFPVCEGK